MRTLFLMLILIAQTGFSQDTVTKTKTEVIDELEKKLKKWNGEDKTVAFELVRTTNMNTNDTRLYVSISVTEIEKTVASQSINLSMGSFWNSVGASSTVNIDNKSGQVILNKPQVDTLFRFLNDAFVKAKSTEPDYSTAWTIRLNDNLMMGFSFEKNKAIKWKYFIGVDDAYFDIDMEQGMELLVKIRKFRDLWSVGRP